MAVIGGKVSPALLTEVDATWLAAHVTKFPAGNRPRSYGLSYESKTLSHAVTAAPFAFRNSSPLNAVVIRYMKFSITDMAAASPAAAIEYGMSLFVARHWVESTAGIVLPVVQASRKRTDMVPSRTAQQQGALPDIRVATDSTGNSVVLSTEQYELDTQPFMAVRGWHLIAGATVQKTVDVMEFNARSYLGAYPLVLEVNEGISLYPAVSTWAAISLTVQLEWEEVPYDELNGVL